LLFTGIPMHPMLSLFSAWNGGGDGELGQLSVACDQLKTLSQLQVTNTEE